METTSYIKRSGYPNWISPWTSLVKKIIFKIVISKMISWSPTFKIMRSNHMIFEGGKTFEKLTSR
jgi:hypothetical protein